MRPLSAAIAAATMLIAGCSSSPPEPAHVRAPESASTARTRGTPQVPVQLLFTATTLDGRRCGSGRRGARPAGGKHHRSRGWPRETHK
jgi:hypothetical protein